MKQRYPAVSLRVPGFQAGGMRRITPGGATPSSRAAPPPAQGGAAPPAPTSHLARRHVTKVTKSSARARQPRVTQHPSGATAAAPVALGQAVARLLDELSFAAHQPGSYQRMGGF